MFGSELVFLFLMVTLAPLASDARGLPCGFSQSKSIATDGWDDPSRAALSRRRVRLIDKVIPYDNYPPAGFIVHEYGIWEARLDFGPGYRLYFGRTDRELVLLLLGGDKSSQTQDIKRARAMWGHYLKELKDGEA